jgi:hypothetical protein
MRQTINLAKRLLVQNRSVFAASLFLALPFPGTKFYEIVEEKGRFLYDLALNSATIYKGSVYEMDNLKSSDVNKMFTKGNREITLLPSFIWRVLKLRKSLSSIPRAIKYLFAKFFCGGRLNVQR